MRRPHTHTCRNKASGCKASWSCNAPIVDNFDGWPEAYCSAESEDWIECEECHQAVVCEDCGVPEHLTHAPGCVTLKAKAS